MVTPTRFELRKIDEDLIQQITRTIVERFHPKKILLFGSQARGTPRPDSDLDLIVEMESEKPWFERNLEVQSVFGNRDWAMDLIVLTPEEMERGRNLLGGVVRTAEREGRILYERC